MAFPEVAAKVATYSAVDLVTIITQLGVFVGVIVGGVVTIIATLRNGQKTERLATAVIGDENHQGLVGQVKEVHTLTNANMTAANNKIDKQTAEIKSLQEMIQELKSERNKKELAEAMAAVPHAEAAKPAETTINMEVAQMDVEKLNVPEAKK